MDRDTAIRLAIEAKLVCDWDGGCASAWVEGHDLTPYLERFAALVAAAEREKVVRWMMERGYATGHGDTIEDLLTELEWQVRESEREACAKVCEAWGEWQGNTEIIAKAIRARGETK